MLIKTRLLPPQQKPPLSSEIDWGHPLSRGLVGMWSMAEYSGGGILDLASGRVATLDSTVSWSNGGVQCTVTGKPISCPDYSGYQANSAVTITIDFMRLTTKTGYEPLVAKRVWGDTAGISNYEVYLHTSSHKLGFYGAGGVISPSNVVPDILARTRATVIADKSNTRFYTNGLYRDTQPTTVGAPRGSGLYFGAFLSGIGEYFSGVLYSVALHMRALTPDEVRWLHAEPYAMLRPAGPARRYFTVTSWDQVHRLRGLEPRYRLTEQPARFRLRALGARYAMIELPARYAMRELGPKFTLTERSQ